MLEAGVFHGVCEEEFFTRGCIKPPGNLRIVRGRTGRGISAAAVRFRPLQRHMAGGVFI